MQDYRRTPASEYALPIQVVAPQSKKGSKVSFMKKPVAMALEKETNGSSRKEVSIIKEAKECKILKKKKTVLSKKVKAYEEKNAELERKYKELQDKLHKTQDTLNKVCNTLDELQKTSLELSSVNYLMFKALRFGCGVGILVQVTSLKIHINFFICAWKCLMLNAFGNKAWKQNKSKYQLNAFNSNHITLLRTEQLLLLQENSYLLNQVEILQKARKESPQKAEKILSELSKSVGTSAQKISSESAPVSFPTDPTKKQKNSLSTLRLFISHFTYILECQIQKQTLMTFHILRRACKLSPFMYAGALTFVWSIRYLVEETLKENFCIFQKEMQHKRQYGIQDLHNCLIKKKQAYITKRCSCNLPLQCVVTKDQLTRECPSTTLCEAPFCTNISTMENVLVTPKYYYRFPSVVQWMEDAAYQY